MQKGPRGGGRDRDHIVRHTLRTEQDWATKLGVRTPEDALLTDEGLKAHRDAYCTAIRAFHAEGKMARTWPLRYLIRHTAFHTLDHAWEMEDKDLTVGVRVGGQFQDSAGETDTGIPVADVKHLPPAPATASTLCATLALPRARPCSTSCSGKARRSSA